MFWPGRSRIISQCQGLTRVSLQRVPVSLKNQTHPSTLTSLTLTLATCHHLPVTDAAPTGELLKRFLAGFKCKMLRCSISSYSCCCSWKGHVILLNDLCADLRYGQCVPSLYCQAVSRVYTYFFSVTTNAYIKKGCSQDWSLKNSTGILSSS